MEEKQYPAPLTSRVQIREGGGTNLLINTNEGGSMTERGNRPTSQTGIRIRTMSRNPSREQLGSRNGGGSVTKIATLLSNRPSSTLDTGNLKPPSFKLPMEQILQTQELLQRARQNYTERSHQQKSPVMQRKHSYKVLSSSNNGLMLTKLREAGLSGNNLSTLFNQSHSKLPHLVQRQVSLKKEGDKKSPFLQEQERLITPKKTMSRNQSTLQSTDSLLQDMKKNYLPIDAYDPYYHEGGEDPRTLIAKYAEPDNAGVTLGVSKWFFSSAQQQQVSVYGQPGEGSTFEYRPCLVLEYLEREELFEIKWLCNGQNKRASRFNIIFKREDLAAVQRRMDQARDLRERAELVMKYNYLVSKTKTEANFEMSDQQKTRISILIKSYQPYTSRVRSTGFRDPGVFGEREPQERYRIPKSLTQPRIKDTSQSAIEQIHRDFGKAQYSLKQLASLFKEIDKEYAHTHRQIMFEHRLPFSAELHETFNKIVPREMFIPVQERAQKAIAPERGLINIPERSAPFKDILSVMQKKLHQASQEKLESLNRVHENMIRLENVCFFKLKFTNRFTNKLVTRPIVEEGRQESEQQERERLESILVAKDYAQPLDMFMRANRVQAGEVLRELRNCMFDSQYEVNSMVQNEIKRLRTLNEQRRRAASCQSQQLTTEDVKMSGAFIQDVRQFQGLLNSLYERQVRGCFEQSVVTLTKSLEEVRAYMNESLMDHHSEETTLLTNDGPEITESQLLKLLADPVLAKRIERKGYQWKMSLTFDKEQGQVKLNPSPKEWLDETLQLVRYIVEEISFVQCFQLQSDDEQAQKIGSARPEGRIKIFAGGNNEDPYIIEIQGKLSHIIKDISRVPVALEKVVKQYEGILACDLKQIKKDYKMNDYPIERYQRELEQNSEVIKHLEKLLFAPKLQSGLFVVRTESLRKLFTARIDELNKMLFQCIKKKIEQTNGEIEAEVKGVLSVINKEPLKDIEELSQVSSFLHNMSGKQLKNIRELIQDAMKKMGLLEVYQCRLADEEFARTWLSFSKPLQIFKAEAECKRRMKRDEKEFFSDLRVMVERLLRDFEELKMEFEILQRSDDLRTDYEDAVTKCDALLDKLERALNVAEVANRREHLFGLKLTDFSEIENLKNNFMPYNTVWCLAREYFYKIGNWMSGPLGDIDRDKIPQEITEACQSLLRMEKVVFKERRQTAQVCSDLRKLYESFKPYLPLIIALKNPSLKMRHWENLQKLRTPPIYELESELHVSISELAEGPAKIMELIEELSDISDCASREKKLEDAIQKMKDEWKFIKFEMQEFRDSGTYVLKAAEPIWDLLDDHIMKTMTIASSPYIKFLQSEVNYWKYTLVKVQEILEEWTKTQRGWLYLWPIFVSEDIQHQLPVISASFQTVDKLWRSIMASTHQNPNVLDSCLQARVYENLQQANEMIERVQKGLNEYLHTKRLAFPRFFFLSNDDLLHILSQTKDPLRIQDHLNKCFEGIDKLQFTDQTNVGSEVKCSNDQLAKNVQILGMQSSMGELISFSKPISPFQVKEGGEWSVRSIEDWLADVELQMRESLRRLVIESSADFVDKPRKEWLFAWPQQIILTMDQVQWTSHIEKEGIEKLKSDSQAMKRVYQQEEAKLKELVELIKQEGMSEVDVMTLGALIVLDVHSKDVTKELLISQVSTLSDFDWISQLRYYIGPDQGGSSSSKGGVPVLAHQSSSLNLVNHQMEILVKMVNTTRLYGLEYLGNQSRLVITPLTDRCYRTLMGALQLNLGGAPEGPAGTGKTETTKDLAKAVAKQCIVFNCSDQLNVESMAKFFKGLACCGAWACFDEFNRIELEVLSVIAQQILTIQTALMRRRAFAPFIFDDEQIPMNPSCAVFITMNPGYAGRSELPDNLKALFRPVAMMIPNYSMIAEISLYSFGFLSARELSVKITSSLKLASEQLSTQSHYDYGMRAVKSIILAAGSLKRLNQTQDEARLILRAISDCNIPKFLSDDIPLFKGIISDLFPSTNQEGEQYQWLLSAISSSMMSKNLNCTGQEFIAKVVQLYETVQVRHGLMMVGATMSGKTTSVHILAQSLSTLANHANTQGLPGVGKVKINTINPKAVSIGHLYGDFDKISHDWSDGVLASIIKDSVQDKSGDKRWIMMDGPVDAVWIENLNTVLDDNKKLCLSSGEIVKFTPLMTMMFEVEDLLEASPATVSRCGMVYLDPEKLGWEVLLEPWIKNLPAQLRSDERDQLYDKVTISFVRKIIMEVYGDISNQCKLKQIIQVSKNCMFLSFLRLLESLLLKNETRKSLLKKEQEQRDKDETKKAFAKLSNAATEETGSSPVKQECTVERLTEIEKSEIQNLVILAAVWSFGGVLPQEEREMFSTIVQRIAQQLGFGGNLSEANLDLYKCFFSNEHQKWLRWDHSLDTQLSTHKVSQIEPNIFQSVNTVSEPSIDFKSIIIPTEDTIRYTFILNQLMLHSFPVVFLGETGTGKTSTIKTHLAALSKDEWEQGQIVFSATITATQVQSFLHGKLEKQKKGVYGPKVPGHRLAVFIDDLNMPAKEKYGAQPPIEVLRQVIDNGGYYDVKTNEFISLIELVFIGAMGLPGGGRTIPTSRLLRHFNVVNIPSFSSDNLYRIFSQILEQCFTKYPESWQQSISSVTKLSIALYENAVKNLLPLPAKSHYLFNLRQVGELIHGLTLVPQEIVRKRTKDPKEQVGMLQRLWVHESMRVFSDRLINEEDQCLFLQLVHKTVHDFTGNNKFPFIESETLSQAQKIIFNNFVVYDPTESIYQEASQDIKETQQVIAQILELQSQMTKEQSMNLLMFDYMIQHLSRISRIIHKPNGNGVLIGLGGNGRRTLSKLAAFLNDCNMFKVDVGKSYSKNDWQDDLKTLFKSLGIDNKKTVFMFQDSDIKGDYCIEDISSILNVGEVPNLFTHEEVDEVTFELQKTISKRALIGEGGSESHLREMFGQRCRKNFHLLMFMSPAGSQLRQYIRQYPALVNCTSIDWFLHWPSEALTMVANHYIEKDTQIFQIRQPTVVKAMPLSTDDGERELTEQTYTLPLSDVDKAANAETLSLREKVTQAFVSIHTNALKLSEDYFNIKGRRVYITPTRFTENFAPFSRIIQRKTKSIDEELETYIMGIKKLEEANMIVDGMKAQLEELKPILDQKTQDLVKIMINLERETRDVEAAKAIVDQEAYQVYQQRDIAEGIKNECQTRLAEAQPLLDSALNALRTLNVKDFVIMKSFNTPPAPIKLTLEAACIMLGIQPKLIEATITKGATKKQVKIADYWEKSKKLLNDYKKFLSSLEHYEKDDIPEERMHKIQDYLNNPKFIPEEIRKASEAAEGICKWVIAICKYDIIAKEIRPKREALGQAQQKLDIVLQKLREKEVELQKIIDQKNKLEEEFKAQNFEKHSLIAQRDECQAKLNRAFILMGSLSLEKERWIKATERLLKEKETITGDSILASAFITYLGAFEGTFRERALKNEWRSIVLRAALPIAEELNLAQAIGVPVQSLQSWQLKGLPQDSVSVENMIILEESKHQWPLLIDPQGYAVKFLKEYLENDFISIKVSQNDGGKYLRKLETALFQGSTVICEEFTDVIDQTMKSVVLKEIQEVRGEKYIKFNDNQQEFNERFSFFMVTMQSNPHFQPELHARTRILNFSVTLEGLEQQLLSVVCRNESTRDEDEKDRLLRQNIEFQEQKRIIEDQILEQLRNSGTDILDDDTLVNSLNDSKKITDDIKHKLASAKVIEEKIEENRRIFKPIASQAAKLYFVVQQMSSLDPMYQFSMKWFRDLFVRSFTINEKVKDIKGRVRQLKQDFSKLLYQNVCRCLFEQHKLMFAFNMAINLHMDDEHGEKESFSRRLKELEAVNACAGSGAAVNQHLQQMAHIKGSVGRVSIAKRSIIDKKSDSTSQAGTTHVLGSFAKNEEEKLKVHKEELHYLLTGLLQGDKKDVLEDRANPCEGFIDAHLWQQVCEIASMHQFDSLPDEIEKNHQGWKKFVQKSESPIPEPFYSTCSDFSQIILYKVLKPEKTIQMIQRYVAKALGAYFIKNIIHSVDEIFQESKPNVPIILILTPGNDPMEQIKKFGEEKQKIHYPVSLGKGQGEKAKAVINECKQYGGWVVLQNCHLAVSFLPELEQIYEQLQPQAYQQQPQTKGLAQSKSEEDAKNIIKPPHQEFRMWLTSMSTDSFPFQLLSDSIKLTSEPPKGLKASLQRIYSQVEQSKTEKEFYNSNSKANTWKRLYLALTFFHGIVRERRKYGSLGWNLSYDFNDSDFRISMRQLHLMVDTFEEVPFRALNYLAGECNYGGRVTDDWDRRTLISILKDFYTPLAITEGDTYQFNASAKDYHIPPQGELDDYVIYISSLPDDENPSLLGLHPNAFITQAINDSQALLANIVKISSKGTAVGNNASGNAAVSKMAYEILAQVREQYKVKEVEGRYPFRYEESLNSVLLQELARYNTLINEVRSSLSTLILTLDGKVVMSPDMERLLTSLLSNSIPDSWRARSYPSRKPLLSYVKDLCKRLRFLDKWISEGQPSIFWLSGFYFTQSFLTGVKQNYARKYRYPIDRVSFAFNILGGGKQGEEGVAPEIGCYATGLFMEGASWRDGRIEESEAKVLFCQMPPIHFIPKLDGEEEAVNATKDSLNESQEPPVEKSYIYQCPVYKTSARAGTLSTTGHSTNYILTIQLPSKMEEDHWIKRSVALLTQLDD